MSLIAIVDVGSTSVGGALLVPNKDRQSRSRWRVVYTTRHRINFSEQIEPKMLLTQMSSALKGVLGDFATKAKAPKEVHCFLSAPFYAAQARIIRHQYDRPTKITVDSINSLVNQELKRFTDSHDDKHSLIESRLMSIKLNGYLINQPYGQAAQEVEIVSYFSVGANQVLDKIRAVVAGAFHHRQVNFHTMALSSYQVWQQIMPEHDSYLMFDIGGEVTELSVVSRDLLWETLTFPLGENYIVRQVAKSLKTTLPEAYSTIKRQVMDQHHQRTSDRLEKILTDLKTEWLSVCRQALDQAGGSFFLPNQAWLIGDPGLTPLFGEWLEGQSLDALMMAKRQLKVDYWRADWFLPWCLQDVQARQDLSLMAEAIYYDKIVSK